LGIIYKLLEGSRGDGKEVVHKKIKKMFKKMFKKSSKKSSKKGQIKVRQKGSNDSIAEYCIMANVRKKFEKRGCRKIYHTILKLADHTLFKMVRYVLRILRPLRPELKTQLEQFKEASSKPAQL
jgi:L-fucose isomerase-like protein